MSMTAIDYIIYGMWIFAPTIFLLMILWSILEKWSGKQVRDNLGDYYRQVAFLSTCVVISVLLDLYAVARVASFINTILSNLDLEMPILFFRLVLFPLVVVVAGYFVGGSKEIETKKNPLLKYNQDRNKRK